ncbi:MAG: biopolymer transporter ExbD [Phycisphaerales bacterium]|nr:MAG: biopolymer transporter ExbD [Phycisphaerales bacterium]
MRYVYNHHRESESFGINLTPMVDVIFLLTIFFMLVSRFSSAEQIPMDLPKPEDSQAEVAKIPERVVVNCRLADPSDPRGSAVLYSVGPNRPERLEVVADRLGLMKQQSPGLQAVIRADRRLQYTDVRRVMRVIAQNKIEMLNVVAHVSEEE